MAQSHLVSIVITNHNYARYVREAVDSALSQTYPSTEVIVVDDGSTDESRESIAGFGGRVASVFKDNGGQASAFNAGLAAARGDVVLFLDADDVLLPTAAEASVRYFDDPEVVKVHWPLHAIDRDGRRLGKLIPGPALPQGDLRELVRSKGPSNSASPPTSGNAWARSFLDEVAPVPEAEYRICADDYLFALAPALGRIKSVREPQALYRIHGRNNYYTGKTFDEKLALGLRSHRQECLALQALFQRRGIEVDLVAWREHSWYHRLEQAIQEIADVVPAGDTFILIDQEQWGTDADVSGRRRIPFLERDGQYWGPPPDDDTAIEQLERARTSSTGFLVVGWPAFWWLDYYGGLHRYLRARFPCLLENERIVVFDLRRGDSAPDTVGAGAHPARRMDAAAGSEA